MDGNVAFNIPGYGPEGFDMPDEQRQDDSGGYQVAPGLILLLIGILAYMVVRAVLKD